MKYGKPPLSFEEQANRLIDRGLVADRDELIHRLESVNYYRLSGYLLTICHFWLGKISRTTKWRARLFQLFDEFPEIPLGPIGLPVDWRAHPLWKP